MGNKTRQASSTLTPLLHKAESQLPLLKIRHIKVDLAEPAEAGEDGSSTCKEKKKCWCKS